MFKKMIAIATVGVALLLTGCSKPVSIPQTSYGVISSADTGRVDWTTIHTNQNMLLSQACNKKCDKGYQFDLPIYPADYNGDFTIPKSERQALTLNARLTFAFNRDGGQAAIVERLKLITTKYQPRISGSPTDNQIFTWDISQIVNIDLPLSTYKALVRPLLTPMEITVAHDDIAARGETVTQIIEAVNNHLAKTNSVLKLVRLDFTKIDLPPDVKQKNSQEYNLAAQERMQERQLKMKRKRVKETHLLNLEELENDVELLALIKPILTDDVLAYKWIQFANNATENGIPVAITPEMLAPATGKVIDESFDMTKFMQKLKERKADMERQVNAQQNCDETTQDCSELND